jgi:hypothetical protein
MIPNNSTILFQGDSITDCGRSRDAAATPTISGDSAGIRHDGRFPAGLVASFKERMRPL